VNRVIGESFKYILCAVLSKVSSACDINFFWQLKLNIGVFPNFSRNFKFKSINRREGSNTRISDFDSKLLNDAWDPDSIVKLISALVHDSIVRI
jgi:hypothetical protein